MSTRTARDKTALHQNRWASSPEFERGLIATGVAKRCSVLDDPADRELIWFLHHLSHWGGGLAAVAADLLKNYSHRLGTPAMAKLASRKAQHFSADEVKKIRMEMPADLRRRYPLRGETARDLHAIGGTTGRLALVAERACELRQTAKNSFLLAGEECDSYEERVTGRREERKLRENREAEGHPGNYPVSSFYNLCSLVAAEGMESIETQNLERNIAELCLDPARDLQNCGPWYFAELVNVLRECHQQWIKKKSSVVVTALGKKVCETLDYTVHSRSLTLLEGNARLGKSFSARNWCEQHPGRARFVEVPGSNDDAAFFRALARGLGLGNFMSYKTAEIRDRVEQVLRCGDIILVLDEAQRLWPQRVRYSYPSRIIWVMTLANEGLPICMISTPQFILAQKVMEKNGWNSAQLTGRIGYYEFLPTDLEASDLMAVGRAVLPEASDDVLKALAIYARTSARYLAAVDTIAKRARYIAQLAGRAGCNTEDIRTAMKESVIPSDTLLAQTLDRAKNVADRRRPLPAAVIPDQPKSSPGRETRPAMSLSESKSRREITPALVEA